MLDPVEAVAVAVQPGERADRARGEQKAVGVAQRAVEELAREHRRDRDPGEVVVGERGVADVGRDEDLARALALDLELRVGEVAGLERGVDDHLVVARLELSQLVVRQAEAPGAVVVGGAIRDQVRVVGKRVQALAQGVERQRRADGLAVGDDVEGRIGNVDDAGAVGGRDVGVAQVPLVGDDPVEDADSRWGPRSL